MERSFRIKNPLHNNMLQDIADVGDCESAVGMGGIYENLQEE